MSAPLWQYADYLQYAGHPSPLVREWALKGLEYHYPEQGLPVALKLLDDPEEEVSREASLYLAEHATARECPSLLDAFFARKTKASPVYLKALGRAGYVQAVPLLVERLAVTRDKNEMLMLAEILASLGGPLAREALLRLLAQVKTDPLLWSGVAASLARLGQSADLRQIAADYFDRLKTAYPYDHRGLADIAGVRELAEALARIWTGRGKRRQELLDCAVEYFGPDFPVDWFCSADLAPLWRRITRASRLDDLSGAVLEMARQVIKSQRRDENMLTAAAALTREENPYRRLAGLRWLLLASLHQEARENNSRRIPGETAGILLACLFALAADPNYGEVPADTPPEERERLLMELLTGPRPEVSPAVIEEVAELGGRVVKELTDVLVKDPAGWGALRAVRVLRQLARRQPEACLPAAPALLAVLENDAALDLMEDCVDVLATLGPAVLPLIDRAFQNNSRSGAEFHLLSILGRLPYPEAVAILARQEQLLFAATESYCLAVKSLASASFLELYRREWRPGEFLLTETLLFLAELHGQPIPELPRLRREYREYRQRQRKSLATLESALKRGILPERDDESRSLELKCRRCGRVYHYEVEELFVDISQYRKESANLRDALLIQEDIVCKGCGAVNDYEYTNAAMLALTAEIMLLAARGQKESSWLTFGRSTTFDGKEIPLSKMPAYFERLVQRSPANAALRVRYGNVLRRLGRVEEALAQYQTALRLEPDNAEAAYALGTLYQSMGQGDKAAPLLARGEAFLAGQPAVMETAGQNLRDDPPDKVTPVPVRVARIGRNQPCPCGSGKKYKHCCGRR
ncbi:tetratricopeptide repeat protein [Desulfofundulus thermosubterraneus]|uniref:Tetratricopeptide repeat-containing protein n=1 Tax=Desulfofundulus thermosubterraneus DSM 16057 TaxID=1121432 RepID=A0A1M6CSI7_9FIRM|nr:tetratricopeptide repeat protein [Desulfofundulus thermosubterraneus]SHI64055.1 Tetratricopeptide repeat-containing protein [Desulfofundulus thermosubterraneus DSM 16057]